MRSLHALTIRMKIENPLLESAPVGPIAIDGLKGASMARTRYQECPLHYFKGKRTEGWKFWHRVDELKDGKVIRPLRKVTLLKKDYPTEKLARRRRDEILEEVNDPSYRARPNITFKKFAEIWIKDVLSQQELSTQSSEKSRINKHLIPVLGDVQLRDLNGMMIQRLVATSKLGAKSVHNLVKTLKAIWTTADSWGYVHGDPFKGLKLKEGNAPDVPYFTVEQVKQIIAAAGSPYNVVFWLAFETGIRRGEVCALNVGDVDLASRIITVRRSCYGTKLKDNKSRRPRIFSISEELAETLRFFVEKREASDPLFVTPVVTLPNKKQVGGKRLHPDNFVARHLKPIVDALGISGGMHAFRHGNATYMDRNQVPMATRQGRLGHMDPKTTMRYTHAVSEDDRRIAEQLGDAITEGRVQ